MFIYDEKKNEWIRRDKTRAYQRRKSHLKSAWIGVGLVMALMPPTYVISLAILGMFVSLSYLDETPYGEAAEE